VSFLAFNQFVRKATGLQLGMAQVLPVAQDAADTAALPWLLDLPRPNTEKTFLTF
jgi:hypothetical protein